MVGVCEATSSTAPSLSTTDQRPAPMFTIVLNTYNRAPVVPRAVRGVLAQSFEGFELVVVDDGSTDDTEEVISRFHDPRLRYIRKLNAGLAAARNTGLAAAHGDFVAFMDDDDQVEPSWLERLAGALNDREAAVATCGTRIRLGDGSSSRFPRPLGPAFGNQVALFLPGTFAVRRDVLNSIGGYWEEIRCSEQTELALRVLPFCEEHQLGVTSIQEALVITNRADDRHRPLRRADYLAGGAIALLERHGDRLRSSPRTYGDFATVAAVQSARLGQFGKARALLIDVIRTDPTRARSYARLALACVPPLGRRVWGSWHPRAASPC